MWLDEREGRRKRAPELVSNFVVSVKKGLLPRYLLVVFDSYNRWLIEVILLSCWWHSPWIRCFNTNKYTCNKSCTAGY